MSVARPLKVRIGLGLGAASSIHDPAVLADLVDGMEELGFDSLWVSERVNGPTLDPLVAMTFALTRSNRLKVGTSVMVLPGRNPVLLAKALASLDVLSGGGRLLPAMGLGVANPAEQQAFGVERRDRAAWFDEALPLLRRLWAEDRVTHHGERFHLDDVAVEPKPVAGHLDVWLGGAAPAELRRCGRLGDGWLPSFTTPAAVAEGMAIVHDAAARAGRAMDPEHFGVLIPYTSEPVPPGIEALVAQRVPGVPVSQVVAGNADELVSLVNDFIAVGASKFVVFPLTAPSHWGAELDRLAETLLPLET